MPAHCTISKGLSEAQTVAWKQAMKNSGLTRSQAIDSALQLFVEAHGELWPASQTPGGARVTVPELLQLMDALMINQEGEDYDRRRIPADVEPATVEYAVARGYCTVFGANAEAAPTFAGAIWHWNNT